MSGKFVDADFPKGMVEEIDTILAGLPSLSRGVDTYDEVYNSNFFYPLQRRVEAARMLNLARSVSPKVVCEIGADKGGGLFHWCMCLPSVKTVIAIEIRGTPYRRAFEKAFPDLEFFWGEKDSRDPLLLQQISQFLSGRPIDVLFIDGEKAMFEEDFDAYAKHMVKGGIVFVHDVCDSAPGAAFERLKDRGYETSLIVDRTEVEHSLRKEAIGIPPSSPHDGWLRYWKGRSCGVGVVYL
jgi:predicted O-methyltransferase YrrM